MDEVKELEARLSAALDALERKLAEAAQPAGDGPDLDALRDENERLQQELADLNDERERDLAQLDQLIAQLKPLVEEAN
jgi:SMC interacting uncharacterized protein involved in chromosome segregation